MSLLSKAIKDLTKGATKAAQDTVDAAEGAAQDVAEAFTEAGKRFVDEVGDFGDTLGQIIDRNTIAIRNLRSRERSILRRVYETSLPPLDRILVVSLNGFGGRAFAVPASMLATLAVPLLWPVDLLLIQMVFREAKAAEYYLLFLGRNGYNDAINGRYDVHPGDTLVHEAGHVWQGYNSAFTWAYIFNSVYNQGSGGAYTYTPGRQWKTYGAEEQAKIVEDWYARSESTSDKLYPYIKSNVRPGKPHATTDFSSGASAPMTSASAPPKSALITGIGKPTTVRPGFRLK